MNASDVLLLEKTNRGNTRLQRYISDLNDIFDFGGYYHFFAVSSLNSALSRYDENLRYSMSSSSLNELWQAIRTRQTHDWRTLNKRMIGDITDTEWLARAVIAIISAEKHIGYTVKSNGVKFFLINPNDAIVERDKNGTVIESTPIKKTVITWFRQLFPLKRA